MHRFPMQRSTAIGIPTPCLATELSDESSVMMLILTLTMGILMWARVKTLKSNACGFNVCCPSQKQQVPSPQGKSLTKC